MQLEIKLSSCCFASDEKEMPCIVKSFVRQFFTSISLTLEEECEAEAGSSFVVLYGDFDVEEVTALPQIISFFITLLHQTNKHHLLFPQPSIIALHLLQDVISVEFEQETN
jgi:hypothetical protein